MIYHIQGHYLRVIDVGVGVHRTLFKSVSSTLPTSALFAVLVVLSSSRRAAGVRFSAASDFRGVHDGGSMSPFRPDGVAIPGVRPSCPKPKSPALARRLFDALFDSL